jgi:acyl-CoA thioesterase FadM
MSFFAMQYRVLFHDTMAYGSHHHMTNFKFQNVARETILFDGASGGPSWKEQLKDIVMLTREAYSLNLAPVKLGDQVGVLLSYEDPSRSSVRLCFRVVDSDGQPISCGYQTMILIHKDSGELVPAPTLLTQYLDADSEFNLLEQLIEPTFADRLKTGSRAVKSIFPDSVRRLGKCVASAPRKMAYPKIIDEAMNESPF